MKPIPGTNNIYWATEFGEIYSCITGKILKTLEINSGYYTVLIRVNKKSYRRLVHRLVASAYLDRAKIKDTVNHKNGDKKDNRPFNLEYMSYKENEQHAYKIGKKSQKYSVEYLVKMYRELGNIKEISRRLGMSAQGISHHLKKDKNLKINPNPKRPRLKSQSFCQ